MLKRVLTLAAFAVLFVPAVSHAVDHSKAWALGYYNSDAPIGIRYMFSEKAGLDVGVGFSSFEGFDAAAATPDTKNFLTYNVDIGVPITLVKTDRADFFFRPGFLWSSVPYQFDDGTNPISDERASDITIEAHLGAEWHVTDNFSLSAGHGIDIVSSKDVFPGELVTGSKPESSTSWGSRALSITDIGFHWYFN
jgi:hypothetical protein